MMPNTIDPASGVHPELAFDAQGRVFELRLVVCAICRVDDAKFLGMRGGSYHRHGSGIASRVVQCRRCGLIYANPFPLPRDKDDIYTDPGSYFARHDQAARLAEYSDLAREIRRRTGKAQPVVLDVGSGRGDFIHAARQVGLEQVTGIEFARAMVDHAREHFDVGLFHGTLEQYAGGSEATFDVVVLNAILEHVPDPASFLRAIEGLTHQGSLLYLDIPREPHLAASVGNALSRLRGHNVVFNISPSWPPFHIYGFGERTLTIFLAGHGFVVEDLRVWCDPYVPSAGGFWDAAAAFAATTLNRVANVTGTAGNMYVWARRTASSKQIGDG